MEVIMGVVSTIQDNIESILDQIPEVPMSFVYRMIREANPDMDVRYAYILYVARHSVLWRQGKMIGSTMNGPAWVYAIMKNAPLGEHIIAQGV
jgi:hypothetical protein